MYIYIYHIFFIHSSVDGHFHVLAIVNSAAMNMRVRGRKEGGPVFLFPRGASRCRRRLQAQTCGVFVLYAEGPLLSPSKGSEEESEEYTGDIL